MELLRPKTVGSIDEADVTLDDAGDVALCLRRTTGGGALLSPGHARALAAPRPRRSSG